MINLNEEDWFVPGVKQVKLSNGNSALQLALVVDGEIASFIGVSPDIANIFLNAQEILDVGEIEENIFQFNIDGEVVVSNEMIYSIMVSNPLVVHVNPEIQRHAEKAEPGWLYQDGQFIIPGEYE
jgi:hypothetical protein